MKLLPQTQYIANRVNKPVRLVGAIQCHNEEEFIELNLKNHYALLDEILIIEGAVKNRKNSTIDGHSIDKTIEIIKSFPDPDKKIRLIQIDRPWHSLEEMKNKFLEFLSNDDILCIIDADEFYHEKDFSRIRNAFDRYPALGEIIVTFRHLYGDFNHIALPGPAWSCQHQRIVRFQKGMHYRSHPILTDADGMCTYFSPIYQNIRCVPTVPIYLDHFGYARVDMDKRMTEKREYYAKELSKHNNANIEFDEKTEAWFKKSEKTLLFDKRLLPAVTMAHPTYQLNLTDLNVVGDWKQDKFYSSEHPGNIHLCMTKQSQPFMDFYENSIDI